MKLELELDEKDLRAQTVEYAAKHLANLLEPEARTEVVAKAIEEARDKAREELERVLSEPFVRSNAYGEKMGEPMTLRELVTAEIHKALAVQVRDGYSVLAHGRTLIERLVEKEVQRQIGADLASAMKEAAAQVREALKEQGAQVLADTIERVAQGRRV